MKETGFIKSGFTENPESTTEFHEKEFAGKVIVITGASRANGIGAAIAREFARQGAAGIVLGSRDSDTTQAYEVQEELIGMGTDAIWRPTDITEPVDVANLIFTAKQKTGKVDVLVNNAGIILDRPLSQMTIEDHFDPVILTNLRGAYATSYEAFTQKSFPKEGASIINIGSIVGKYGNIAQENYASAKAGIQGLTKSLAKDLGRRGIRVNAVLPGFVTTEMTKTLGEQIGVEEAITRLTPLGRLGTPEDIAQLVTFLASSKASFITGQCIEIDGGLNGGILGIPELVKEIRRNKKHE